jgi:endonuclease/exonuclease/phosphatase family metal-dependent hydrolase
VKYLAKLMLKADVIGLQEVHGTKSGMHEVMKQFAGWDCYFSPSPSPAAGGVAILVHRHVLSRTCCHYHRVLLDGRALQVHLQFAAFALNLVTVHIEPAATRHAHCQLLRRTFATSAPEIQITIILADLNTCMPGDGRIHLDNLHAVDQDDALGQWITSHYPHFVIAEHDGHTRIGRHNGTPTVLSRIDYVLIDLPKVTILDSRFAAHVHGDLLKLTASDHAAVVAHLHPPRSTPPSRLSIPSWLSSAPTFKNTVEQLIAQHNLLSQDELLRDDLIEIFRVAAARIRSQPPTAPLSDSAKLYWCLVACRSQRHHNQQGVQRARTAYPGLVMDNLDTEISELTIKVADNQLHSGPPTSRKTEAAGQAYMQKIALWRRFSPRARFMYLVDEDGNVTSDDCLMATRIREHWKSVFQVTDSSPRHHLALQDLTASVPHANDLSDEPFCEEDVQASLQRHDSAPGPDGICYSAWKAAGPVGIKIIHDILFGMWHGQPPPASFLHSLMVFLPKVDSQAVRLDELRPLALCDSDYKVVMGCINHRLALHVPDYVDDRQRGFIKGRLGLDNVLLLEAAAMLATRSGAASPILCFLDLAAAFPSILHDFMMEVLNKFLGQHPLNVMIGNLYKHNRCDMLVRGNLMPGFAVLCGVRQGCPLSGTLFALVFHPIVVSLSDALYKVSMHIGHDIFAYADDVALVMYEFWRQLPALDAALSHIAAAAGLRINWKKVQLIPLWRGADCDLTKRRLTATCPHWKLAKIGFAAKYLGIQVGPGVTDASALEAPLAKYISRCRFIAKMGLGWVRAAAMHNIFALPVLSYVAQVQGDAGLRDTDLDRAAAILFKNPMYRPPYTFYLHLSELGCGTGLKDVRVECRAAAARCSLTLSQLGLARRHLVVGSDDDHLRLHLHRQWQDRSAVSRLAEWHDQLRRDLTPLPGPPKIQQQCRAHLLALQPRFDYYPIIRDRLVAVLRRIGDAALAEVNIMAANILDTIILASSILHCTALQAFLRVSQNGLTLGGASCGVACCPMCGAEGAARLSHLVQCGVVWVFLAEHCPGLGWDYSAPERWRLLFGMYSCDSWSASLLCLAWDAISAGSMAGRFAGEGFEAAVSRLVSVSKRPGHSGRVATALMLPPPLAVE